MTEKVKNRMENFELNDEEFEKVSGGTALKDEIPITCPNCGRRAMDIEYNYRQLEDGCSTIWIYTCPSCKHEFTKDHSYFK